MTIQALYSPDERLPARPVLLNLESHNGHLTYAGQPVSLRRYPQGINGEDAYRIGIHTGSRVSWCYRAKASEIETRGQFT